MNTLPSEIILTILDFACTHDGQTVRTMCALSSSLRTLCLPKLWHTISFSLTSSETMRDRFAMLAKALHSSSPNSTIHRFIFEVSSAFNLSNVSFSRALLQEQRTIQQIVQAYRPTIRMLVFLVRHPTIAVSVLRPFHSPPSFPQLKHITFGSSELEWFSFIAGYPTGFQNITRLTVRKAFCGQVFDLIRRLPNLEILTLFDVPTQGPNAPVLLLRWLLVLAFGDGALGISVPEDTPENLHTFDVHWEQPVDLSAPVLVPHWAQWWATVIQHTGSSNFPGVARTCCEVINRNDPAKSFGSCIAQSTGNDEQLLAELKYGSWP
ncbi:hypothetical protein DL96DRAFT_1578862 [Flagelloscypha sp. PMI_526]|nr:hypothetical protein DL96DRAFT_1578862 [Flagelloscypha sp. PMI_526]